MPFVFLTALTDRDNELKGRQLGDAACDARRNRLGEGHCNLQLRNAVSFPLV